MVITLIGMSGSGKTLWAKKLAGERGYKYLGCDLEIEKKLDSLLADFSSSGTERLAAWMGEPYQAGYREAENTYLKTEKEALEEITARVIGDFCDCGVNAVIDTTGSLVYLPHKTIEKLKRLSVILHLETPEWIQEEMFKMYLSEPKPVVWGDAFSLTEGEDPADALKRCYPELLRFREEKYKRLADVIVSYELRTQTDFGVNDLIRLAEECGT